MQVLILAAGEGFRLSKIAGESPKSLLCVAGVPIIERILRSIRELEIDKIHIVLGYNGDKIIERIGNSYEGVHIQYIENPEWKKGNLYSLFVAKEFLKENFLLLMSDHLFDPRIVRHITEQKIGSDAVILAVDKCKAKHEDGKVLVGNGKIQDIGKDLKDYNCVDTGIFLCSPKIFHYAEKALRNGSSELAEGIKYAAEEGQARTFGINLIPLHLPKMRKDVKPYWIDIDTPKNLTKAKEIIVESSAKEASDLLAHYFHRPIENSIVGHLSDTRITPNQVTILVNIVAYTVTALFFFGHLLMASILTFVVGIMDGLDGKLARVKGKSTKLGTLEHPFDLLYEFFWIASLGLFLSNTLQSTTPATLAILSIIVIAFYRQVYDRFGRTMGKSLDVYGEFERKFRRIAGRRNLYNIHILAWILVGAPLYSLVTILLHSVVTSFVYTIRAAIHMHKAEKK